MTRKETAPRLFEEALVLFRMQEQPEQVVALIDDLPLQKLVAAWPTVALTTSTATGRQPRTDDLPALWDWFWRQRSFDRTELAKALGMSAPRLNALLGVAVRQRLVYPDGSIHNLAAQFLKARIAKEVGANALAGRNKR
jgi:hypothetical protein